MLVNEALLFYIYTTLKIALKLSNSKLKLGYKFIFIFCCDFLKGGT